MPTVIQGCSETISLPAGKVLSVVFPTGGVGRLSRLDTILGYVALAAGTTLAGPHATPTEYRLDASSKDATYSMELADFPTAAEAAAAAALLYIPVGTAQTIGDVKFYIGAGVPVDYTDGSPAATGEAEAGIGSLYIDITNGKLYINGGTKAQPLWKIVTSA